MRRTSISLAVMMLCVVWLQRPDRSYAKDGPDRDSDGSKAQIAALAKQIRSFERTLSLLDKRIRELNRQNGLLKTELAELRTRVNSRGPSRSSRPVPRGFVRKISENLREVTVSGQGLDATAALHDAYRNAVQLGAGAYIRSRSESRDVVLIRDTVLVRSEGFVQNQKVLNDPEKQPDGTWFVTIKAEVSVKGVADFWHATKTLLKLHGNPKIMVFITDRIAGKVQTSSTVQTRIESVLLSSGFLLVDRTQLNAIKDKERELTMATAQGKTAEVRAIAESFGAQLFITGMATAMPGEHGEIGGVLFYRYEATANVRCYRSDTARLVSSVSRTPTRGVARVSSSAAKQALDHQAEQIALKMREDILKHWKDAIGQRTTK